MVRQSSRIRHRYESRAQAELAQRLLRRLQPADSTNIPRIAISPSTWEQRALGIDVRPDVLSIADEVIE
jgi:hypothetical protein